MVTAALPVTAGLLRGPPTASLGPLLAAVSLTLAAGPAAGKDRRLVPVADLAAAVELLRAAVARSPRAAVSCGQLLRQTAGLGPGPGLAAEAALYSVLLGGPEFARWQAARGVPRAAPAGARSPVRMSRAGGCLSIVLDDPGRRNAVSFRMREALLEAVLLVEADETITEVAISGAGPAFCSGGDLDEFGAATDMVAAYLVRLARAPWRVIDRIAGRVTMRVHGACIGAGTEIAAFGGRVVAAPGTFFALPEVGMGLVPGAGGSVSVPRRIGRWRAAWLMLTGERLAAGTALSWGLVDELAGTADLAWPGRRDNEA
jgi:enoyl-CoA hydratase/carnithine racemase